MANETKLTIVDGIKWHEWRDTNSFRHVSPLCMQHDIRMEPVVLYESVYRNGRKEQKSISTDKSIELQCNEGDSHKIKIPREYSAEKTYVKNKIDSMVFKQYKVMNLDDSAIPVLKEDIKDKNNPYWIRAKFTESKSGTRLIIWAGNREAKNKTQLFVEPELKRLSFDQNDDHPLDVLAKVEVTFAENFTATLNKNIEI